MGRSRPGLGASLLSVNSAKYEIIFPRSREDEVVLYDRLKTSVIVDKSYNRKSNKSIDRLVQRESSLLALRYHFLQKRNNFRLYSVKGGHELLELYLGLTDYMDYLCTNHNSRLNKKLIALGMTDFKNPDAYLSNALGNVALLETSDGKIALLERSQTISTFQGYYDLPGGHPEPDIMQTVDNESVYWQIASNELFDSIIREVMNEVNVRYEDILNTWCIGFVRSLEDGRTPEMVFYIPVSLSSDELLRRYEEGGPEADESNSIMLLDYNCSSIASNNFSSIDRHITNMTAATRGALSLYARMKFGLGHEGKEVC